MTKVKQNKVINLLNRIKFILQLPLVLVAALFYCKDEEKQVYEEDETQIKGDQNGN